MSALLNELGQKDVLRAGELAGRTLLERAIAGGAVLPPIEALSARFMLISIKDSPELADAVRAGLKLLLDHPHFEDIADDSVGIASNTIHAVGWGAEASRLSLSIGFSLVMVILASNLSLTIGEDGSSLQIQAGFPAGLVEVVNDIADAVGDVAGVVAALERDQAPASTS